jgi:hypothetical protein
VVLSLEKRRKTWWIEHGPLPGGRPEQEVWNHSGHGTKAEALKQIGKLINVGCTVHSLTAPSNKVDIGEK